MAWKDKVCATLVIQTFCWIAQGKVLSEKADKRHLGYDLGDLVDIYSRQKGVAVENVSLLLVGSCNPLHSGPSRDRVLRPRVALSTIIYRSRRPRYGVDLIFLFEVRANISYIVRETRPVVIYQCADVHTLPIRTPDLFTYLRPFILFMILERWPKSRSRPLYAAIHRNPSQATSTATLKQDHWNVDSFFVNQLDETKFNSSFQLLYGSRGAMRISAINKSSGQTRYFQINITVDGHLVPHNKSSNVILRYQTAVHFADREYLLNNFGSGDAEVTLVTERIRSNNFLGLTFSMGCLRPLAVVEPSELVLVAPFSGSILITLLLTIIFVAAFVVKGYSRNGSKSIILVMDLLLSLLGFYRVDLPQPSRHSSQTIIYEFQRKIVLGLTLVMLQVVLINVYKSVVTSLLLEPDPDLLGLGHRLNISVDMEYPFPYAYTDEDASISTFYHLLRLEEACWFAPHVVETGLRLPMKQGLTRNVHPFRYNSPDESEIINSKILMTIREHALTPMISRFTSVHRITKLLDTFIARVGASLNFRLHCGKVAAERTAWGIAREVLMSCGHLLQIEHKIKQNDDGDTVAIGTRHIGNTIRLTLLLLLGLCCFALIENEWRHMWT